ncbi:MAG: Dabb family protein [Nitrospiraceae bacterium]|nr:Dabb family protein [Nitrospiraceae bacterium]
MIRFGVLLTVLAAVCAGGCVSVHDANVVVAARGPSAGVRHVVLFKLKDGTTPDQRRAIEESFAALAGQIDEIVDLEWGTDTSPEGLAQGFTHCFIVSFENEAGRDAYLPHPKHRAFVELAGPHFEKVLVVDFKPEH